MASLVVAGASPFAIAPNNARCGRHRHHRREPSSSSSSWRSRHRSTPRAASDASASTAPSTAAAAAASSEEANDGGDISSAKRVLMAAVDGTENGLSCTESQRIDIEALITNLECLNPTDKPASSPLVDGNWRVVYSTAPPPSNGSLGPFKGTAFQDISLADNSYANVLTVPPNDWQGGPINNPQNTHSFLFLFYISALTRSATASRLGDSKQARRQQAGSATASRRLARVCYQNQEGVQVLAFTSLTAHRLCVSVMNTTFRIPLRFVKLSLKSSESK